MKPGANKSDSKYSIVKKLGRGRAKPEKTNVEFVPLETRILIALEKNTYICNTIFPMMRLYNEFLTIKSQSTPVRNKLGA